MAKANSKKEYWGINCGYEIEVTPENKEIPQHFFGMCEAIHNSQLDRYYINDIIAVAEALGFKVSD